MQSKKIRGLVAGFEACEAACMLSQPIISELRRRSLSLLKDGACQLKTFFPRCMIMQEMQILTSPIEIEKEN